MFFPDDAVRVAALSEYVDRHVSDRLLQRPPEASISEADNRLETPHYAKSIERHALRDK